MHLQGKNEAWHFRIVQLKKLLILTSCVFTVLSKTFKILNAAQVMQH